MQLIVLRTSIFFDLLFTLEIKPRPIIKSKERMKDSSKKEATSKPAAADATKTTEKSGPEAKLKGTGAKKQ